MNIKFGPAGLGPVKTAEDVLEGYAKKGLRACELAFTRQVYIKQKEDAVRIGKKAEELGIYLSIHAPYYVNLNSNEEEKIVATKKRILDCCEVGEWLGAKTVVFHPGYYMANTKEDTYEKIKEGILDIMGVIKKKGWKVKIAPETMGKVNVFGSVEEISKLVRETGCSFCIDFAHILARDKSVNYSKLAILFPQDKWHCHFSGIVYGEKGEKHHISTEKKDWNNLLSNLKKHLSNREFVIINESPTLVEDSVEGLGIFNSLT